MQMLAPAFAQLPVVDPLVEDALEPLADVLQPVLELAAERAARLRPLDLVVQAAVRVGERFELLADRECMPTVRLRGHAPSLPGHRQPETRALLTAQPGVEGSSGSPAGGEEICGTGSGCGTAGGEGSDGSVGSGMESTVTAGSGGASGRGGACPVCVS